MPKMPKVVVRLRRAIDFQGLVINSDRNKVSKVVWRKKIKIGSAEGAFLNFRHFNIL